ncbi:unnamed protein product [Trifolium pratense]|uniref:Uncharacterized protein n=1 Tax=Trifolium pratense TaxID=57577 RepID=A0ACB0KPQ4_TRIPR|nr:unnamed protein product [Trifolium pratense]
MFTQFSQNRPTLGERATLRSTINEKLDYKDSIQEFQEFRVFLNSTLFPNLSP